MNGLGLLLGHLLGDYVLQTDWQARNKANPHPGPPPKNCGVVAELLDSLKNPAWAAYYTASRAWRLGHFACAVHCTLYTLAVWACSFWWMPWWGLLACWLAHFPVDRWRLARKWMWLAGQEQFATGPLSPWSIIVVDNTIHLLVLFVIGLLA